MNLPLELVDYIISFTDYNTVVKCRNITSKYFNNTTKYSNYSDAIKNDNLNNLKWLYKEKYRELIINLCIKYDKLEFFKIFYTKEFEKITLIFLCIKYKRLEFLNHFQNTISKKTKKQMRNWINVLGMNISIEIYNKFL
jgi:hypothetical protein